MNLWEFPTIFLHSLRFLRNFNNALIDKRVPKELLQTLLPHFIQLCCIYAQKSDPKYPSLHHIETE